MSLFPRIMVLAHSYNFPHLKRLFLGICSLDSTFYLACFNLSSGPPCEHEEGSPCEQTPGCMGRCSLAWDGGMAWDGAAWPRWSYQVSCTCQYLSSFVNPGRKVFQVAWMWGKWKPILFRGRMHEAVFA